MQATSLQGFCFLQMENCCAKLSRRLRGAEQTHYGGATRQWSSFENCHYELASAGEESAVSGESRKKQIPRPPRRPRGDKSYFFLAKPPGGHAHARKLGQTNLYATATPEGDLVWSGISDSFNPSSAAKAIDAVVKVVVKKLEKEGIL
ncbi:MAG: hypothetical protein ACLPND_02720 [Candidatus Korobacteraceae bacterium]|jgi:hypothetical protein